MSVLTMLALMGGGIIVLVAGGEFLVRGAAGLAIRLGLSPLLIGLVVVGFGTSTPELTTSVTAALEGAPEYRGWQCHRIEYRQYPADTGPCRAYSSHHHKYGALPAATERRWRYRLCWGRD